MDQKEKEHEPVAPLGVTLRGPFWFQHIGENWFAIKSESGTVDVKVQGEANADFVETALNEMHENVLVQRE